MVTMMLRGDDVSETASPLLIACLARDVPTYVHVRILAARLRTYVRTCVRTSHYVVALTRKLGKTVHYVQKSAPAPRNPNTAAAVHCVPAQELRTHVRTYMFEPRGAPWLMALC